MRTPTTPEGLRKFDNLPPSEAVTAAWTTLGRVPDWDRKVARLIRDAAPLLARALDRLAAEQGRQPVDRAAGEAPRKRRIPWQEPDSGR